MSEQKPGFFRRLFRGVASVFRFVRNSVLNILFLIAFITFLTVIFSGDEQVEIPPTAALVLDLKGDLVEEKTWVDPLEAAINESAGGGEENPEVLVRDIVKVIENATRDDRIKVMVLALADMGGASQDKLRTVGSAIEKFKATGKKVYATGTFYGQSQYFLASYADHINLNPNGAVLLEGYGSYPMFYKSALEKLKISTHVFKVGTYKSAVEPFIRDDMSPEAKEANKAWLDELWQSYKTQVAERRGFEVTNFDETFASLYQRISEVNGDMTEYALKHKLVDSVLSRENFRKEIIEIVGEDTEEHTFNQVNFKDYHHLVIPKHAMPNPLTDKVALVVARGTIVDGSAKPGTIGGDSTAALLRDARLDDTVKAVVLRIDSGGGSAFASEIISDEIRLLKAAGKPVVASMGAVAASGGYWIAAPANEIWAAPTTITGSIGIFALFHTAEQAMATLGLNVDGVGTTELAGFSAGLPLYKGLQPDAQKLLQLMIERGYDDFITHVSNSRTTEDRKITKEDVDKVGQGRVWTGTKALEFGLVDKLGTLDDAIASAANMAGLKQYDVQVAEPKLTPQEMFMRDLFATAKAQGWIGQYSQEPTATEKLLQQAAREFNVLGQFNDPNGIYSVCFSCKIY